MNLNKKYLLLIVLFIFLVSIPVTFATDNNDTQLQDNANDNSMTSQDQHINTQDSQLNTEDISTNNQKDGNSDIALKNHSVRQKYSDETGNHPANETSFTLNKQESEPKIHFSNRTTDYIYSNDDSYGIWWDVYDEEDNFAEDGIVNVYLNGIYVADILPWDDTYLPLDQVNMGNNDIKLIYHFENDSYSPVEISYTLIKSDLIRPDINITKYNHVNSILEDSSVDWEFEVIDKVNYEKVNVGTVTLYISNRTGAYMPIKTVNATENFYIDIFEISNLIDNDYYPKHFDFHIQYNGDNITYGQSYKYGGSTLTIINKKKSNITYEGYEVCEEGTKIYYKALDSNNEKIAIGDITLALYLTADYENDPNTHYYNYYETYPADLEYLLIPELNLTEHIGAYCDITLKYNDNDEYHYSWDDWYGYLRINLTYEFPEEIHAKLNQILPISVNFTDENNSKYYPNGKIILYGPSTLEYEVPTIKDFKNPRLNISEITETPGTYQLRIRYENSYWGYDENEGLKYIIDPKYNVQDTEKYCTLIVSDEIEQDQKIEITPITINVGETVNITAKITENNEIMTNLSKGKVTFKVNGKTLKDENGKIIYAKVVNGTATIENYIVPDDWAKEGTTIQAVYSGSTQCAKLTSEKTNITVNPKELTLTTTAIQAAPGQSTTLTATLSDNTINTGKIVFKINGKTVKDTNGKVIYAKVTNGTVSVDYTLPEIYKAGNYTVTATFIASGYDRLEATETLTVTA